VAAVLLAIGLAGLPACTESAEPAPVLEWLGPATDPMDVPHDADPPSVGPTTATPTTATPTTATPTTATPTTATPTTATPTTATPTEREATETTDDPATESMPTESMPTESMATAGVTPDDPTLAAATTYTVIAGDHLWGIARRRVGVVLGVEPSSAEIAPYWRRVIVANTPTLRSGDPNLIFPGETLTLPEVESAPMESNPLPDG
jgi:nucleoid-associated protein YgaU